MNPNPNPNDNPQIKKNDQKEGNGELKDNTQHQIPEYQKQLKFAYQLYLEGQQKYKAYSLEEALIKFEKANEIVQKVYPEIKDDKNKAITNDFMKKLQFSLETTHFQYNNRFEHKTTAGFASRPENKPIYTKEEIYALTNGISDGDSNQYTVQEKKSSNINQANKPNQSNQGNNQNSAKSKEDDTKIVGSDLKDKIMSEIIDTKPGVQFNDVIGLGAAKQILREIIIIPNLRPELFVGLRAPPRGLLLFGPPGTGKTMIAKAVATECKCTFFNISSASLTSKYVGESEKLVRALFDLAFEKQPSVVFIDEIESILSKRNENENEAMKRLKTEFLVQFDGVGSNLTARVLIIGATNRPQDLDPAVLRRLPKRVLIGPFDEKDRKEFIKTIMQQNDSEISDDELCQIAHLCTNYSNSDLKELCREAAYEPLRDVQDIKTVQKIRPINFNDFNKAIKKVRGTLTKDLLNELNKWNEQFGALN